MGANKSVHNEHDIGTAEPIASFSAAPPAMIVEVAVVNEGNCLASIPQSFVVVVVYYLCFLMYEL